MKISEIHLSKSQREIIFLLGYRWASLLPVLWPLLSGQEMPSNTFVSGGAMFAIAFGLTLLITLFNQKLNMVALRHPIAVGVDLIISAAILGFSGGVYSPYYLYAISPLLAIAFFFQLRGALYASLVFTPLYFLAINLNSPESIPSIVSVDLLTKIAGIWLVPLLVGYLTSLMGRLQNTQIDMEKQNEELALSHRQLNIIHDLATLIQAAPDIQSVTQSVLEGITNGLGYTRAATVLVDPVSEHLGNWRVHPLLELPTKSLPALPLNPRDGQLLNSIFQGKPAWFPYWDEIFFKQRRQRVAEPNKLDHSPANYAKPYGRNPACGI